MIDLGFEPLQAHETVYVQDEPALDIALPQVFDQPALPTLQRGRLGNAEALVAQIFRRLQRQPQAALGSAYQELVTEFQPLFAWATASWDYLLCTEGCRFIPRTNKPLAGARGDYRAVTDKDYSRLVHQVFRACVLEFAQQPAVPSLCQWLRERFWPLTLEAYRRLDQPMDPRQRALTPYSYLRCAPYQFLNEFHQELVYTAVQHLPNVEQRALDAYFLNFLTETSAAEALGCPLEACQETLRQGLVRLLVHQRLVYCLLRQIERY
jgi:DNA-directed RNA polymerase specialized sigma24 family protein